MPRYLRARIEGGTFFFTVTLADRSGDLLVRHVELLRRAYGAVQKRFPFETVAICVLPDHLHAIGACRSPSNIGKREKGIWQRRYWEHVIRDENDLARHIDYIHFNPVKHGLVSRVCDWPHSSFHRYVASGMLAMDWGGDVSAVTGSFGE